jgi:transcriptional regulator with XRE-family HTH domain
MALYRIGGETTVKSLLPDLIRAGRDAKGMSQWDLANAIGKDQTYISKIERGVTVQPDYMVLRDIGDALEIPFEDLVLAIAGQLRVEADADERPVRFAGLMPADSIRWCEVEGKQEMRDVWTRFLGAHDPEQCFLVQVSGDCLLTQGIRDGQFVLLRAPDANEIPRNGVIVAVRIGDEYTLKVWFKRGEDVELRDGDGHIVYRGRMDAPEFRLLGIYLNNWSDTGGMR